MYGKYAINILLHLFIFGAILPLQAQRIYSEKGDDGLWVMEGNQRVIFFQSELNDSLPEFARNNYFHPLHDLDGRIITEDFPADHPHHRGVFWAWHQLLQDNTSLGDGWHLKDVSQDVEEINFKSAETGEGTLTYTSYWESPLAGGLPFLKEENRVTVYPQANNQRRIVFKIRLMPLVDNFSLGGSKDIKGYGGFSVRLMTDEESVFTLNDIQKVSPQKLAITGGDTINISSPSLQRALTIINNTVHSDESQWILRQNKSMQNCAWPGSNALPLEKGKSLELSYTLIIHRLCTE